MMKSTTTTTSDGSTTDHDEDADRFLRFLEASKDRTEPREMLIKALGFLCPPNNGGMPPQTPVVYRALDLGCGCGQDTLAMLERGMDVTAVDSEPEAIRLTQQRVQQQADPSLARRLTTMTKSFEHIDLDSYASPFHLINAQFCLPFFSGNKTQFAAFWEKLLGRLIPGQGIFAGQVFGINDEWNGKPGHTAHLFYSREEVEKLISGMERLYLLEDEKDGRTATGNQKHWHLFHMVLRR